LPRIPYHHVPATDLPVDDGAVTYCIVNSGTCFVDKELDHWRLNEQNNQPRHVKQRWWSNMFIFYGNGHGQPQLLQRQRRPQQFAVMSVAMTTTTSDDSRCHDAPLTDGCSDDDSGYANYSRPKMTPWLKQQPCAAVLCISCVNSLCAADGCV